MKVEIDENALQYLIDASWDLKWYVKMFDNVRSGKWKRGSSLFCFPPTSFSELKAFLYSKIIRNVTDEELAAMVRGHKRWELFYTKFPELEKTIKEIVENGDSSNYSDESLRLSRELDTQLVTLKNSCYAFFPCICGAWLEGPFKHQDLLECPSCKKRYQAEVQVSVFLEEVKTNS